MTALACSCPECATERSDTPVYPCRGPRCDQVVETRGDLCPRCENRLDNAIDHRAFPDPCFWDVP
jgi:hypothetical protein